MQGTPVDQRQRQEGDGDDGLRVQNNKGEAQQARHVGKQEVGAEGQCVVHNRRVAAEPIQQPPYMRKPRTARYNYWLWAMIGLRMLSSSEAVHGACPTTHVQLTPVLCSWPAPHCKLHTSDVPDGLASNQAIGAPSTAHSIRLCSSRAAMRPAVAKEKARTYASIHQT